MFSWLGNEARLVDVSEFLTDDMPTWDRTKWVATAGRTCTRSDVG